MTTVTGLSVAGLCGTGAVDVVAGVVALVDSSVGAEGAPNAPLPQAAIESNITAIERDMG